MRAVTPRAVVEIIDRVFGDAAKTQQHVWETSQRTTNFAPLDAQNFGNAIAVISEMVDAIPDRLITNRPEDFTAAKAAIAYTVRVWEQNRNFLLSPIRGFDPLNPVVLLRRSLDGCPDAVPIDGTDELPFLEADPALRDNLRLDISSADESFASNQWKAACVLAASVVEALLNWALRGREAEFDAAAAAVQKRLPSFRLKDDRTYWSLHQYTELALELGIIDETQAQRCRLAKDARNLIHPGAEERRQAVCDRPGALSALAALHGVVEHLTKTLNVRE